MIRASRPKYTSTRTCQVCSKSFRVRNKSKVSIAKYCPVCRPGQRRSKRVKYLITEPVKRLLQERYDSTVRGRVAEICAVLGWPKFAVAKAAKKLGLATPWPPDRREWTAEELAFVEQWTGMRSARWIATQLRRGEASVINKQRRLRLSRRVRDGSYSACDLAKCFGIDVHCVTRWIELGWLEAERRGTDRPNDAFRIEAESIRRFIRRHRGEFLLKKVDQDWFLTLLLGENQHTPAEREPYLPAPCQIERTKRAIRRRNSPLTTDH